MRSQIARYVPAMAILVSLGWMVGQSVLAHAASFPYLRLAQLNDGDTFYIQLGRAAMERGDNYRAVRLLTSAIKKGGGAQAFKYRCQAFERLGQDEKALADLDRYIQLKPRDPWGYTKRGMQYSLASHHDKAMAQFLKATRLDPSFAASHFGLGIAYTALERHEAAIQEFQKVLDIEPGNSDALLNMGIALMLSGRSAEARSAMSKALQSQEDPRWRDRLQRWIASLPSTAETRGPSAGIPADQPDGTKPASNSIKSPGTGGTGYDPKSGQNKRAGSDRGQEQARTSRVIPGDQAADPLPSSRSQPMVSPKASPAQGPIVLTGKWRTKYRGIEIGVSITQEGDAVSGVMTVDGPLIGNKSYPFDGKFSGGILKGRSSEGHTFQGRVYDTGQVVGKFELKGGPTIPVNFRVSPGTAQKRGARY